MLTVDPKWVEEVNSEVKESLKLAMREAEHIAKRIKRHSEWMWLKLCHKNAWDQPILHEILSNKPTTSSSKSKLTICKNHN